ncbi:hydantoinase/oxoprolinase family protein [bacterium]|nr:hydantoinase/oxoprolinase family protein [bacterium]MDA9902556.1 hydantoinase/oxoprolinase family protein [Gammaproteobacteria bacterium]MDB2444978.1 hydantoinase/oxoprolinase family protein [Gammaproteobacteria bacterium]
MQKRIRIGVDVGGTFTDFVLVDEHRDMIFTGKQLTTPTDPGKAICEGVSRIVSEAGIVMSQLDGIVHGTTLVTNAVIERLGAKVGLITTSGFRDVLEVGHEMRYDLYDLFLEKPEPLVPRNLRLTVNERIASTGEILAELDEAGVNAACNELISKGVDTIAVCLINAYVNPEHEKRVRDLILADYPDLPVTISTVVAPEIREYERTCTAVANAYVLPLMRRYIDDLQSKLTGLGLEGPLNVMLSGGGIAALRIAQEAPIQMIESGPAAGAISGAYYGRLTDTQSVIAFDMGGTTAKMCLIEDFTPEHANTFEAGRVRRFRKGSGVPLKVPVIDLIEIGAGGGSISRLDAMGLLKVGPDSAASEPGPVCYGLGGENPTVTDADLLLGYLSPEYFLGGEMSLDVGVVRNAIEAKLATPSGMTATDIAAGIHAIVNNNMAAATRAHIAEKGRDPRRYTLVATGGAGPVHAYGVAKQLKLNRFICPLGAGVSSALGFLIAAPATEGVHSYVSTLDQLDAEKVLKIYEDMSASATKSLVEAGGDVNTITIKHRVEMRYRGQGFEISVDLPNDLAEVDLPKLLQADFVKRYAELFGRSISDVSIETVTWRISASGPTPNIQLNFEGQQIDRGAAAKGERLVFFPETGYAPCKIYNRYGLASGMTISGPAVIEERESTVVAGPDTTISVDDHLNLIIDIHYDQVKD